MSISVESSSSLSTEISSEHTCVIEPRTSSSSSESMSYTNDSNCMKNQSIESLPCPPPIIMNEKPKNIKAQLYSELSDDSKRKRALQKCETDCYKCIFYTFACCLYCGYDVFTCRCHRWSCWKCDCECDCE